jgi:hypothetical protein
MGVKLGLSSKEKNISRIKVFENRALRRVIGIKIRNTGRRRKLYSNELYTYNL